MHLFLIGAGYVGLTTAVGFARLGHRVTGYDLDPERVARLAAGRTPIWEPGLDDALAEGLASGRLRFTSDPVPPADVDVAVVCVPTPMGADGVLDISRVESSVAALLERLPADRTVVVRSTMSLDAAERLAGIVGDRPGPAVVVNPEFMREGHALADFAAPSRVVVGALRPADRAAAVAFAALYEPLGAPVIVGDAKSVILIKLASNVFLSTKIAFADELARLCDALGADASVVLEGVGSDPRIGRSFLEPGPGFGGSCLPEQAAAIAVEVSSRGLDAPLFSSIAPSNRSHRDGIVRTLADLVGGLEGRTIALLGLAFKANTDDVRESPALHLAAGLRAAGARVVGYDPVASATARRADPVLEIADSAAGAADGADGILVATEWAEFGSLDWAALAAAMRGTVVYDTRRCVDAAAVAAAGLRYVPLGRAAAGLGLDASPSGRAGR